MHTPTYFDKNLKRLRIAKQLTQKELADLLGYTEKSVSKWETGNGFPTLDVLTKLSEIFCVSLDDLVFEDQEHLYYLGIDGGGTKTLFALMDDGGTLLHTVEKGPTNPNDIGMDAACAILKEGIHEVRGHIPCSRIAMFAGLSGGGLSGSNAKILNQFFAGFGFKAYDNGSDIDNLIALTDGQDCILVIMGTGCIVYAIHGNEHHRIAGWGQLFDEGGCGYTLGRDIITAALREIDTSGPKTLLTTLLAETLGESPEQHLVKFYQKGKRYIASFSDLIWPAIEQQDTVAQRILKKNMDFVAHMINTGARYYNANTEIPVYCAGGISKKNEILFPLIKEDLDPRCQLHSMQDEPITGALLHAGQL